MTDNRNVILAIVLSMIVLFGWQFFIAGPQLERAQQQAQIAAEQAQSEAALATPNATAVAAGTPGTVAADGTAFYTDRAAAIAATDRVVIDTPDLHGSINLTGARLDDLELKQYRETVDPESPIITLLTPAGAPNAYFAEQGWVPAAGAAVTVPDSKSVWSVEGNATTLNASSPITLRWDNGDGLTFRRTFAVDEYYLFTVTQSVENNSSGDIALFPYARVARHGTPQVANFFIQHEGPHGVLGSNNMVSKKYSDMQKDQQVRFDNTSGWLGFSDKYWATAALPKPNTDINALFSWKNTGAYDDYQTSFVETTPVVVAAGATATNESYLFAGAKEEAVINRYQQEYGFDRIDLLIDWGWFSFLTKPMYYLLTFLNGIIGNFGLAVMAVTVIVKAVFFPLASRSYASMAAMRRVQPEMKSIQERLKDDRPAQQQAMMELYKKEKINPLSGCWPVLIQIPVFFALYTVIFISLDMRHAPFFGWIRDLAAPDPTNIFTLFGLIPWDPTILPVVGGFLHLGVWPVIMGLTMWVQMKLNPPPPDPTQAMIFNWMPVIFTFMLGTFPAGLVIYWAWNNTLSVTQQYFIMKRHGAEVNLLGNILDAFKRKPKANEPTKP
ncbi:membrane protein insertase YidC [Devosia sp. BSSL-BM10]|jgi:YidC/Oxa1 family membrane protein insertase|uniref:Membrane protein insertase YidC n=1 Tax=Devosia litorisediminis TaxID=2829817 RepID=A0A942E8Z1_9HYPH|nr:membrane protein insertase YidC [Devosia litorisediminis]MBS3849761.1 membrane protein insertase YidC [Devosia litorisediminis]|tara:strand:- start:1932 stop:3767 length:1836 start_codon:yes stop_codon:yes gene_type:complete